MVWPAGRATAARLHLAAPFARHAPAASRSAPTHTPGCPPARGRERQYSWPPDPLWTESNWPFGQPHLELFLKEVAGTDWAVLVAGLAVSTVAAAGVLATHAAYGKRLKQS